MAKKKLLKYTEIQSSMRYVLESNFDIDLDEDDDSLLNEAVDNFIEDLGISEHVQFDVKEREEESSDELRFDE